MAADTSYTRILVKQSSTPGYKPTIPASNDHTDGTWGETDIYIGELYWNSADGIMYTRTETGIQNITQPTDPSSGAGRVPYLIGSLIGFDCNTTSDQAIALTGGSSFIVTEIIVTNASGDLGATAFSEFEFFEGPGNTKAHIANSVGAASTLSNGAKYISHFHDAPEVNFNDKARISSLYAHATAAAGSAITCDIFIYGFIIN
jgi:hypothetical protein